MPKLGLSSSLTTGNSGSSGGGAQTLWKVAVFGAGQIETNGEYIWDGSSTQNGKSVYVGPPIYGLYSSRIYWDSVKWRLILDFDPNPAETMYESSDLITWTTGEDNGADPVPFTSFSYSQNSFISSITISYFGLPSSNGTYSRLAGGTTLFSGTGGNQIIFRSPNWDLDNATIEEMATATSTNLLVWTANFPPPLDVTAVSYSA